MDMFCMFPECPPWWGGWKLLVVFNIKEEVWWNIDSAISGVGGVDVIILTDSTGAPIDESKRVGEARGRTSFKVEEDEITWPFRRLVVGTAMLWDDNDDDGVSVLTALTSIKTAADDACCWDWGVLNMELG